MIRVEWDIGEVDKANINGGFSKILCLKEVYTDFD